MKSQSLLKMLTRICLCCCLILFAAACSRQAKAKRHFDRADRFFQSGEYSKAEIEYMNGLRQDRQNTAAIRQLGFILFEQGRYPQAFGHLRRAKSADPNNLEVRSRLGFMALLARNLAEAREEALFILGKQPAHEEALVLLADSVGHSEIEETKALIENYQAKAERLAGYHVALGLLQTRANDLEAAEASFKEAVQVNPQAAVARAALGNFYLRQKRLDLAEEELKAAAAMAPARSPFIMSHADFKINQGRVEEGKKLLEGIAQKVPDFLPARIRLAELAFSQKNYDESAAVLKGIFARGEANFDAQFLQGRLALARGNTTNALSEFQRLAAVFPKVPQVHYQLALAHLANRDTASASASMNEALNLDPNYAEAILLRAELDIRKGDYLPATTALSELISRDTNVVQAHVLLAAAHAGRKNYPAALAEYQKLAEVFPKNPQFPWLMGNICLRQKNLKGAQESFERALSVNKDYLPALEGLVELDLDARNHLEALQKVQLRINESPTNAPLRLLLTKVLLAQGETNRAEAALLKAIELDPEHHSAHMVLARIYVNTKRHQQALDRLQAIIQKRPADVGAHLQAAAIQDELKNFRASETHYQKILAVDPNSPAALNNLAYIYSEYLNQVDRAFEIAQKARAVLPRDPAAADTLGWILYKRGEYGQALSPLEESAQMLPDNPEVLFHLGMTHYALGNEDAARTSFEKSLQQGSDFAGKADCEQRLSILAMNVQPADANTVRELEKLLAQRPSDAVVLGRLARIYDSTGHSEKAARTYETILKNNPGHVSAMIRLARYYFDHQKNKEAMEWAQKARNVAPGDPQVAHTLGRLAYHDRDFKWSLSLLQESARKLKDDPQVAFDLARAQLSNGQLSHSEASLKKAVDSSNAPQSSAQQLLTWVSRCSQPDRADQFAPEIQKTLKEDPAYLPARFLNGCLLQKRNDFKGAQAVFESILVDYPLFAPANKELAYLYTQHLANDQKALDHVLRAREAYPQDPHAAKTFGIISYKRSEFRRSADLLKESGARSGGDPEVLFYLGMAQFKLGEHKESGEALRRALALDPNARFATEAKNILAQLQQREL